MRSPAPIIFLAATLLVDANPLSASQQPVAESIYLKGLLPSGAPVRAVRDIGGENVSMEGEAIACANCHRRSGLGSVEGQTISPPIASHYVDRRQPFTPTTLARAVREGIGPEGRVLNNLMPRFDLSDTQIALLAKYLKTLSSTASPGVDADSLHIATIITPDADAARRQAMLRVLMQFFADQGRGEHFYLDGKLNDHPPHRGIPRGPLQNSARQWKLHVWELNGTADSWERQLRSNIAREPVFAVVSGLGRDNWAPIHHFCEAQALPCLFPNVEVPTLAENDFYTFYYSKGVVLEAGLMADALQRALPEHNIRQVVQVFRSRDSGASGASALRQSLARSRVPVVMRELPADFDSTDATQRTSELAAAMAGVTSTDALVLWLRAWDLAALPTGPPVAFAIFSGMMGGLEQVPISPSWRAIIHLSYPFDLPRDRAVRMQLPLQWFSLRHVDVTDERLQSDTYLACVILASTLGRMSGVFVRDYLIEKAEDTLSKRWTNAYYPRLSFAPGQRVGSRGGFVVHFAGSEGTAVEPDGDWIVPVSPY